jgi:hypothetical protein
MLCTKTTHHTKKLLPAVTPWWSERSEKKTAKYSTAGKHRPFKKTTRHSTVGKYRQFKKPIQYSTAEKHQPFKKTPQYSTAGKHRPFRKTPQYNTAGKHRLKQLENREIYKEVSVVTGGSLSYWWPKVLSPKVNYSDEYIHKCKRFIDLKKLILRHKNEHVVSLKRVVLRHICAALAVKHENVYLHLN